MVVIPKFQKDLWDIEKGPHNHVRKGNWVILRLLLMSDTKLLLLLFLKVF